MSATGLKMLQPKRTAKNKKTAIDEVNVMILDNCQTGECTYENLLCESIFKYFENLHYKKN